MSVFETIKNNNLTEAEVEEALKYYLDKKNKIIEKNEHKNKLVKNLINYYDEAYSTEHIIGSELYSKRLAIYSRICSNLVDSLIDAGYKIFVPCAEIGYYVNPTSMKAYPVICKLPCKLGQDRDLPEKIETKLFTDITHWILDKDKQVIALYLPIFGTKSMNLSCYGIINLD